MDLATLRALVLENSGPRLHIGHPQINRVINRAVEHITNLVELRAKFYNMFRLPITISVVANTEVYYLNAATAAGPPTTILRKILQVERTDVTQGGRPIPVSIVDFREKNDYGTGPYWQGGVGQGIRPIVYFLRNSQGVWHMGLAYEPSSAMTIDVYYAPQITELANDTDVPREVPENHHELIAVRATKVTMDQFSMDSRPWDRQYIELRQTMEADLETYDRTGPRSRRIA